MRSLDSLFGLRGKRVLLAGANGILGTEYLRRYLSLGLHVTAVDRDTSRARRLQSRYRGRLLVIEADLTDPRQARDAFDRGARRFGRIDAVHHNIMTRPDGYFTATENYTLETWHRVAADNVETALLITQAAIPHFKKNKRGAFLFTSSIYGISAPDPRIYTGARFEGRAINTPLAYSATKASLVGFVRHLSTELAPWNIRVNGITPGGVASGQNAVFERRYSARVPLGRMARAGDMVGPALFLLSDAASYVTGHNLVVDGGLTVW